MQNYRRSVDLHRGRADLPDLHQLFAEQAEQLLAAYRVFRRSAGTSHRRATRYMDIALSWQHWFSPQVEIRPEVAYYRSLDAPAFNGNGDAESRPTGAGP